MTISAAQFRATYSYLGLSLRELAETLGVGLNSARSWDKGRTSVPVGVAAELTQMMAETNAAVKILARHYETHTMEWPMEIPRNPADVPGMLPELHILSFEPTVDWWKHVGIRVCERVPGLTLDWA